MKKLIIVLLSLILVLGVGGCNSKSNNGEADKESDVIIKN